METALSTQRSFSDVLAQTGVAKYADDKGFEAVAAASYMPRIQLFGGGSNACKEGKIPIAHWGLVNGEGIIDLGKEAHMFCLKWRPKALQINKKLKKIQTEYNPKCKEFVRIQNQSDEKDSGCMFGPEFLIWEPFNRTFATLFLGSKTARRMSPEVRARLGSAMTMKAVLIDSGEYKWHGPVVTICSQEFALPDGEVTAGVIDKFCNPPEREIEDAPADTVIM